jgi:hypothetical protein
MEFVIYQNSSRNGIYKQIFKQGLHSNGGIEQARYKFLTPDIYTAVVTIYYVLFTPVDPDIARFNIST